ncbi:MAG: hypothetical protein JKY89_01785 [Immundisolibacteraceae bacterium]|nr:hypothetical protein [Immundisolibacteraceae bacterium]
MAIEKPGAIGPTAPPKPQPSSATRAGTQAAVRSATFAAQLRASGNLLPSQPQTKTTSAGQTSAIGQSFHANAAQVMASYNLHHASPRQMVDMSGELLESGSITFDEHSLISFQPEFNADQFQQIYGHPPYPDGPRDFLYEWESKLSAQRQAGSNPAIIEKTEHIVYLLHNLNTLN